MELTLSAVSNSEAEDLRSLRDSLVDEDDVRTNTKLSTHPRRPDRREMGMNLDFIGQVLGTGFNIASLAAAIVSWREARHPKPTVDLQVIQPIAILAPTAKQAIDPAIRELRYDG